MKFHVPARLEELAGRLPPQLRRYRALLIVLLAGVLLLASGRGGGASAAPRQADGGADTDFSLAAFEDQLRAQLAGVEGAGRVELMLTLEETDASVYAADTRRTDGSWESDLTVLSDSSYGETPVTVKRLLPVFRGAVVLCDGADDAQVRLAVTQAVCTACGLGSDKVAVLKMAART